MVGVPKSLRCTYCKSRKVKCDEAWPTCGGCQRAGRQCSGPPPSLIKFVEGSRTASPQDSSRGRPSPAESSASSSATPGGSSNHSGDGGGATTNTATTPSTSVTLDIRSQRTLSGGASLRKMRICPPPAAAAPSPLVITPSTTGASQLAARLAAQLSAHAGTGHDLRFVGQSIRLVPARLAESVALRDATECLLDAHAALLQGHGERERLIDAVSYGRALRSLQRALDDPVERVAASTLAATGLLQKTEGAFGAAGKTDFAVTHAGGIYACAKDRGPPRPDDEFDVLLCIEAGALIAQYCMFNEQDPLTNHPEWVQAVTTALDAGLITDDATKHQHRLHTQLLRWPSLVQSLRLLREGAPTPPFPAPELLLQAVDVAQSLQAFDIDVLTPLRAAGHIASEPTGELLFPWTHTFSSHAIAALFAHHAMASIAVARIVQQLVPPDPSFELSIAEWSRRIWLSCHYARSVKPLLSAYLLTPLIVSFEAADQRQRAWLRLALEDIQAYRQPAPRGRWSDPALLYVCRLLSGRMPVVRPRSRMKEASRWSVTEV